MDNIQKAHASRRLAENTEQHQPLNEEEKIMSIKLNCNDLVYDNCKHCQNMDCEHFGKNREFVCINGISCKIEKKNDCSVVFEKKIGNSWEQTWSSDNKERVYEDLAHELVSKKLCGCSYIRSITRKQLYNGFVKITVAYDNGDRRIYTINDH